MERLLGRPCYQMVEVAARPDHIELRRKAIEGDLPDWDEIFLGYEGAVDWPASAFWRELSVAYPDAVVVLSVRESTESWWQSINRTVFHDLGRPHPANDLEAMFIDLMAARFTDRWHDAPAAMAAYCRHNDAVREGVAPSRLVEWRPEDGWEPICARLGLAAPPEPFPHLNTFAEFWARWGADQAGPDPR